MPTTPQIFRRYSRVAVSKTGAVTILGNSASEIQIDAMHGPHGIVPALAFRVRIREDVIGSIAKDADVGMLIISHFMKRSLNDLEKNADVVRSKFGGPLKIARDLRCYPV